MSSSGILLLRIKACPLSAKLYFAREKKIYKKYFLSCHAMKNIKTVFRLRELICMQFSKSCWRLNYAKIQTFTPQKECSVLLTNPENQHLNKAQFDLRKVNLKRYDDKV